MVKQFIKDIFTFTKKEKTVLSKQDKISTAKFYLLAFFVPFGIVLFSAMLKQLAPFGEYNLMSIDAWGQYFPMLREMEKAFLSGFTNYSFSGALGFDLTAQSAYYTNSPLWYILYLIPGKLTPGQVDMMIFFRFALAGLIFTCYLSEHFGKKENYMVILGTAYAFSGYTLAFINQIMWMDAVVLLPLVLLGIEKLYKDRNVLLYLVSLFLTIYTNFYIAFSVCIFAVLWFFLVSITEFKGIRDWFIKAFRFGICSLLAGIANLGVLLPLLRAISNTLASDMGFNKELAFYHNFFDMLKMLLPYGKSSLAYEAPNIYFGIIPAVICLAAVVSKVSLKKKLCYGALAVFMFISLNFTLLDFIWHGFHFPNQLPGRMSFLFIFIALVISCRGFDTLLNEGIRKEKARKTVALVLCCLAGFEIASNTALKFLTDTRCVTEGSILRNADVMAEVTEKFSPDYEKGEFFRTELKAHRYNGGQLHGYNGISHYSSTMSGDCYNFFTSLGMSIYAKNVSIEYTPNPVLNSLFAVKYIVSADSQCDETSTVAGRALDCYVQENEEVLPLFYVAGKDVLNVDMTLKGHALTNDIFRKAAGTEDVISGNGIFNDDKVEGYILNENEFRKGIDNILTSKSSITKISDKKIEGSVTAARDGVLMISLPANDVTVEIDGEKVPTLTIAGYLAGAEITEGPHEIKINLP